jgi:magnesium transporter
MKKSQRVKSKLGMAPGSLVFTGTQKMTDVKISVMQYNSESFAEFPITSIPELQTAIENFQGVSWINIDGLHNIGVIEEVSALAKLHKLTIEDILNISQRPKVDEYENYLYVVVKMFLPKENGSIDEEQLSFVLTDNMLFTYQEKEGDVLNHVRTRLRENKGMARKRGSDYLLYILIDSVVDYYFLMLDKMGERLELLESGLLKNPTEGILNELHSIRSEILNLRRSIYPLREVVSRLGKMELHPINPQTKIFINDLYDHSIQVIEDIEVMRETVTGMLELYMNSISNRMNNVMKVLTIIATIFIPLTFIAGIYGMNFKYMPELEWHWGYFAILAFMFLIAVGMLIYFRRKKWL